MGSPKQEEQQVTPCPLTMLTPPELSALHIPSSGAMPMVVPLNVFPLLGRPPERRAEG